MYCNSGSKISISNSIPRCAVVRFSHNQTVRKIALAPCLHFSFRTPEAQGNLNLILIPMLSPSRVLCPCSVPLPVSLPCMTNFQLCQVSSVQPSVMPSCLVSYALLSAAVVLFWALLFFLGGGNSQHIVFSGQDISKVSDSSGLSVSVKWTMVVAKFCQQLMYIPIWLMSRTWFRFRVHFFWLGVGGMMTSLIETNGWSLEHVDWLIVKGKLRTRINPKNNFLKGEFVKEVL